MLQMTILQAVLESRLSEAKKSTRDLKTLKVSPFPIQLVQIKAEQWHA